MIADILSAILFLLPSPIENFNCYVRTNYYESRGESLEGQFLVLDVVKNRIERKHRGRNCRQVVSAKSQFHHRIARWEHQPENAGDWLRASGVTILWLLQQRNRRSNCRECEYFFSGSIPTWASDGLVFERREGGHWFFSRRRGKS